MAGTRFTPAELTQFGLRLEDEGSHPFDPAVDWWNESWFWDWFDATGSRAGHCRIGIHPNQNRAWLWFYLFQEDEWITIEEPRLAVADWDLSRLAYDRFGLRCAWDVEAPLEAGRLSVAGFGRVVAGKRAGMILPMGVELAVNALGPPHSHGRSVAPGHGAEAAYPASRFEQPIAVEGVMQIGAARRSFSGRGERDHSWGPRHWNLEWTFLVLNGERIRLQCAEARIPNVGRFTSGYLQRQSMVTVKEARFSFRYPEADVLRPVSGEFSIVAENGDVFGATVESVSGAEIDITHTFVPPRRSLYRRALVRATPQSGEEPLLGWVEFNRFLEAG
ncbi:MAG TPA: hypothetical protein VKM54_03625 [Myxococcota bacterium]|nr:hypothetical protein [Myxococcota bacterium]